MNYKNIYDNLIEKAQNRTLSEQYEVHHILPRCMGGTNDPVNLVKLTPEEHYVAHQLLTKIHPNHNGLIHAAMMMCVGRPSNKRYGWLRKQSRVIAKQRTGPKNGSYGKRWYHNPLTLENGKFSIPPEGWNLGRVPHKNTSCEVCHQDTGSKIRRFCDLHRPKPLSPTEQGFKRTVEMNEHMSSLYKGRPKEQHHQYGKRWINNGEKQLMVPIDSMDEYLKNNWIVGKLKSTLS